MATHNRKAGLRRLAEMSPAGESSSAWVPDLQPVDPPYEQLFTISENTAYVQRLSFDERGRLVEWAVIQQRKLDGAWRRVAVYDTCHDKGIHVHFYDRHETEFAETPLRRVASYQDLEEGLNYALERVVEAWQENERRSDRGY